MLLAEAGFYVNTANAEAVTAVNDTYRLNVKAGISFYNWEIVSLATCRNQNKQEQVDVCVCVLLHLCLEFQFRPLLHVGQVNRSKGGSSLSWGVFKNDVKTAWQIARYVAGWEKIPVKP